MYANTFAASGRYSTMCFYSICEKKKKKWIFKLRCELQCGRSVASLPNRYYLFSLAAVAAGPSFKLPESVIICRGNAEADEARAPRNVRRISERNAFPRPFFPWLDIPHRSRAPAPPFVREARPFVKRRHTSARAYVTRVRFFTLFFLFFFPPPKG